MSWYYTSWDGQIFQSTGAGKFIQDRQIDVGNATGWALSGGKAEFGPFATQAEAQKAKDAHPATGPLSAVHSAASGADQVVKSGTSGLAAIGGSLAGLGAAITDGKMWRSLGWLVFGVLMLLFGVFLWVRKELEGGGLGGFANYLRGY